ncbi:MAG: hypothetical protein IJ949_05985 [Oscillospiraceae bacterium]|nr:hypothetical protein [Oscillospiraceae bacterium]
MKNRLLSLVLALAMLISLLPAVSLAGAEGIEQEFTITTAGQTADWEVVSSIISNGGSSYKIGALEAEGFKLKFRGSTPWFNNVREDRSYHVMLRINVKAAGVYSLQVKGKPANTSNDIFNLGVFWMKDDGVEVEKNVVATIVGTPNTAYTRVGGSNRSNSDYLVGSCDFDDEKTDYQDVAAVTVDEPGEYLVAFFGIDKTTATENTTSDYPEMYISSIKLVPAVAGDDKEDDTEDKGNVGVHLKYVLNTSVMFDQKNYGDPRLDKGVLRPGGFADIDS